MNVASGFFVGRAHLKRQALIGKNKLDGVIETSHNTGIVTWFALQTTQMLRYKD